MPTFDHGDIKTRGCWIFLEADDRDAFIPGIEPEAAHAGYFPQSAVQRGANLSAASAVNQPQRGGVGQQRLAQRALDARKRFFDGQAVEIDFSCGRGGPDKARPTKIYRRTLKRPPDEDGRM